MHKNINVSLFLTAPELISISHDGKRFHQMLPRKLVDRMHIAYAFHIWIFSWSLFPNTHCSVHNVCINVRVWACVCVHELFGLCYAINHPFIGVSYGCLPKQISWMKMPPTNVRFKLFVVLITHFRWEIEKCFTQLCVCVHIRCTNISHGVPSLRILHAIATPSQCQCRQQNILQITKMLCFIQTSYCQDIKVVVAHNLCVYHFWPTINYPYSVFLSHCTNCVHVDDIEFGWAIVHIWLQLHEYNLIVLIPKPTLDWSWTLELVILISFAFESSGSIQILFLSHCCHEIISTHKKNK